MDEQKFRNEMYSAIKAQNRYVTESYLNLLSTRAVIANTHPLYRARYLEKYERMLNALSFYS